MKRLAKPEFNAGEIYASCISGVTNKEAITRHKMATQDLMQLAQLYDDRAIASQLHLFPVSEWGNDAQVAVGTVTKGDMISLYSDHMAKQNQPARKYYDRLMLCAPLGKCPYCGFGHISTLDHFLSKARYPSFSVLPFNLVPSCSDCNRSKGSGILDEKNQIPHPYYADASIETDKWLFASVEKTAPVSVSYFVEPPEEWPDSLTERIKNYFREFELASRFSIEAASELISISDYLAQIEASELIAEYLKKMALSERQRNKNTWKAALYEAISKSNWYCDDGWRPRVHF